MKKKKKLEKELAELNNLKKLAKNHKSSNAVMPSFESMVVGELHNISLNTAALVTELKYLNDSIRYFNSLMKEEYEASKRQEDLFASNIFNNPEDEGKVEQDEKSESDIFTNFNTSHSESEADYEPDLEEEKSAEPIIKHEKWVNDEILRLISGRSVEEMATYLGIKKKSYQKRLTTLRKTGEIEAAFEVAKSGTKLSDER